MIKKESLLNKKKKEKEETKKLSWLQSRKNLEQRIIDLHHLLDDAHTPDVDLEDELYRLEQRWIRNFGEETWRKKL